MAVVGPAEAANKGEVNGSSDAPKQVILGYEMVE
jgi:hypothetical protein